MITYSLSTGPRYAATAARRCLSVCCLRGAPFERFPFSASDSVGPIQDEIYGKSVHGNDAFVFLFFLFFFVLFCFVLFFCFVFFKLMLLQKTLECHKKYS